jgi:hypothetical protein
MPSSVRFCPDDVILVNWLQECPLIFYLEGLILDIPITMLYCVMILANLTSLSTPVKEFLVLSFTMVYHAPPACPKHLVDALASTVNALLASWLSSITIALCETIETGILSYRV